MQLTTAVIDVDATRMARARTGSYQPQIAGEGRRIACDFSFPEIEPETSQPIAAAWESSPRMKEEEFTRALTLGLFDYLRKSGSRGFVVSLSGGADSSSVACLVALMVEMAAAELGPDEFNARLRHIPALKEAATDRERVHALLSCAYQASRNSSPDTRRSAVSLAEALGAEMACWEIDELVADYTAKVEGFLGRELTWNRDDLALQNIQARVRGPGVWMLANVKGALLLATSNRSEAAVGYATMDGDTCGGLSPIAGIDKAFLRHWLRWLETEGPAGVHPHPRSATAVNRLAPTAELRPREATQTDEADLMPYEVLDAIERAAIRDKQAPIDAFRRAANSAVILRQAAPPLGRAVLPPLVPQPMETASTRPVVPPRRREPRPERLGAASRSSPAVSNEAGRARPLRRKPEEVIGWKAQFPGCQAEKGAGAYNG